MVATGFDASYFANRAKLPAHTVPSSETSPVVDKPTDPAVATTDQDMASLDLNIKDEDKQNTPETDFSKDVPMPNIWTDEKDEEDVSKDGVGESTDDLSAQNPIVAHLDEDELEKPSFLRRLARRRQKEDESDSLKK